MKRWLKYSLILILFLLITLISGIAWIISTETGLRFIVTKAQQFAPGTLKIETLQGRLLDQVSFTGLFYQHEETVVQVNSFLFNWDSSALLDLKLHVKQLHIDGIELDLPKNTDKKIEKKESTEIKIPDIHLPIQIAIDDVQINKITIRTVDAEPFIIEAIELSSTTSSVLSLQYFQVKSPLFNAKLTGEIGFTAPHKINLALDWSANLPDFTVAGKGQLSGDTQKLLLSHTVSKPLIIELKTTVVDLLGALTMDAQLTWQDIYWPLVGTERLVNSQEGQVTLSGSLDNYQLGFKTKLSGKQIPVGHWTCTAQGNQQALTITKLSTKTLDGVINATGKVTWQPKLLAQINLSASQLSLKDLWQEWPDNFKLNSQLLANLDGNDFKIEQLQVNLPNSSVSLQAEGTLAGEKTSFKTNLAWQGLQWPLVGKESLIKSKKGQINLFGTPQNYKINLKTQIVGKDIPPGKIALAGHGNLQEFTLKSLNTKILQGAVNATGQISWQPKLKGQIKLDVSKISLKKLWKDWPDKLRLKSQLLAQIDGNDFKIKYLKILLPKAEVSLQAKGTLAGENTHFQTNLAWKGLQWPLVGKESLIKSKKGQINLSGTPQNYKINLKTQIVGKDIPPGKIALAGQGNLQEFTLNSLNTKILQGAVNASGKLSWKPKLLGQFKLNASEITIKELWKEWPENLRIKSQLVAILDGQNLRIEKLDVSLPKTAAKLSFQGDLSETHFNTKLTWQGVQWPLVGKSSLVNSKKGRLTVTGTPQAYKLNLKTHIQGQDIPKGEWIARGQGSTSGFTLKSLKGDILQGTLNLAGKVNWLPNISWNMALNGKKLNPGKQWADFPGKLVIDLRSKGQLKNGDLRTTISLKKIQGKLRDYPLKLQTELDINGNNYTIKKLDFKSGKTHLSANGVLGQKSNLKWKINAPNLSTLLPEALGSISGKGSITGPLNMPHIKAKLKGNSLAFQNNELKALKADVNVNLRTQKNLYLNIVATDFKQGTTEIERASLESEGSMTDHTLVAKVKMLEDRFVLKIQGGLQKQRWQGELQELTASTAQAGKWRLKKPAAISLSATAASLAQTCLQEQENAKVCTQGQWGQTAETTVLTTLKNFPLNIIRAFLPKGSDLTGTLNGQVKANLQPDGKLASTVGITLSKGVLKTYLEDRDEITEFHYEGGNLNLNINKNGLVADLDLKLLDHSSITGDFKLPRLTQIPLQGTQPMQGNISVTFADFAILPNFAPQVEEPTGQVNLNVALGGTLESPIVQGDIQVQNTALNLPDLGLKVSKLDGFICSSERELLQFTGQKNMMDCGKEPNTLKMKFNVKSGEEGHLEIKGKAKILSINDWKGTLKINGENFEVINIPEAWALISPNLDISIAPERINVTGSLTIPEVAVTPPSAGSGAIGVSEDIVIVNPKESIGKEKKVANKMAIYSKVKIILGDNVTFDGAGFKSRFGGTLIASNQPGKVTVGNGELYIIEGSYKAFGQNLKIDRGRVFFSGGAIENPGLSIPAYRRIKERDQDISFSNVSGQKDTGNVIKSPISRNGDDEIIAGVLIEGTAKSPKLTFFSDPLLDQSNTLSYIVLGKPVARATESEGSLLINTLTSLSLKGGDSLAKKIGDTVGLDDIGIASDGNIEESALMLGKYLTPDLYISYGIGIFDGSNVLRMRYDLTKRLTLETETGVQSGVDLRYTFEH